MAKLRMSQKEILAYQGGRMGVSAVPGSGKTFTLSHLAAQIITGGLLDDEQEVLIVTLVNSSVDNFAGKIGECLKEKKYFPRLRYRVRTLHGLSHDIVRGRPGLVGLEENFQIADDRDAERIRGEAAAGWLRSHPDVFENLIRPDLEDFRKDRVRRKDIPDLVKSIGLAFIRSAKDMQLTPRQVREKLDSLPVNLPLAEMGAAIYEDYQRALEYRGAVDFDDLIRLALRALNADPKYLKRLQDTWPYILEDEAQDSSKLQEEILKRLAGENGNWVRVGDPNQAIYETFTTASPQHLIDFMKQPGVKACALPESGRSMASVIDLANYLIDWTRNEHPVIEIRDALVPPYILPTTPGDPQPNPPNNPEKIYFSDPVRRITPQEEVELVAKSLQSWLSGHIDETAAVLVPRNRRGFEVVEELKRRDIPFVEILQSTDSSRKAAGALGDVLKYLSNPQDPASLVKAYRAWRRGWREDHEMSARVKEAEGQLGNCRKVEDYLWPRAEADWLETVHAGSNGEVVEELSSFRERAQRWHGAALLPIDQAVMALSQDLFTEPAELAVAHKLAIILRQASENNQNWRLPELSNEVSVIARNERKFIGLSEEDRGFNPDQHKGKVLVTTIHKAKGLEWDRVHLISVNNYDFPSAMPYDTYISEAWYLQEKPNLEAETLAQLEAAFSSDPYNWYQEGEAAVNARLDYVRERLRLLYVGITRARKELIVTWNTGRGDSLAAQPFIALHGFWRK